MAPFYSYAACKEQVAAIGSAPQSAAAAVSAFCVKNPLSVR